MKIVSIEPTPSPNSMKLNLDEKLPPGVKMTYTQENRERAPEQIKKLLEIEGVKSIFHVADFIALERRANADWKAILAQAGEVLGEGTAQSVQAVAQNSQDDQWQEVNVFVQMFRHIPMQVKVTAGLEQMRVGLPERFTQAAMRAGAASANLVMERKWVEQGVRYGTMQEIGEEVAQELDAAYDTERLEQLVEQAFHFEPAAPEPIETLSTEKIAEMLDHPDWKKRYAAFERLNPTKNDIDLLKKALADPKSSIRRLAVVYLGMVGGEEVFPLLFQALTDDSVSVRRTAGDTLSDLGDPIAIGPMAKALQDPNKLVRWRAARFLYEVGDESALPALREAQDDPEFEVSMQVKMALERIERGEEASGTVWQQMTRRNS
ncbi:conserved virulence factor C family protein [Brevibacillus massiliensis]|uniref:conserved virulence factor C family protein n=1 Tax=Brevibacillus massiliensis TaxID=1118054 RepID=UPI00030A3AF3|nr:virulence factor [Brevibacillus massiliensis]